MQRDTMNTWVQRKDPSRTQREDGLLQTQGKGLRRNRTCWETLIWSWTLASRTVRKCILVVHATLVHVLCYGGSSWWMQHPFKGYLWFFSLWFPALQLAPLDRAGLNAHPFIHLLHSVLCMVQSRCQAHSTVAKSLLSWTYHLIPHVQNELFSTVLLERNTANTYQGKRGKVKVLVAQSCPTLCDPVDGSPPGSSVPGISQARILEWVAIFFSRHRGCFRAVKLFCMMLW